MKEAASRTQSLRWHWSTWRMLELTVAAAANARRAGDEATVHVTDRAARVAARELGIPIALLVKMQRDAVAALDETPLQRASAGRSARPLERQRPLRWN
jgi:hypothetical protein